MLPTWRTLMGLRSVCLGVYPKSLAQALANRGDGDGDSLADGWV
ncbi:MAG: hypothetical protein U1E91_01575 [Moraxella sp.]